jgi:transcriptional regulator with XRE-family HTH domain
MPRPNGATLRAWRVSKHWAVLEMARQIRRAAGDIHIADPDALKSMIWKWERDAVRITERYMLLYCAVFKVTPEQLADGPAQPSQPDAAESVAAVLPQRSEDRTARGNTEKPVRHADPDDIDAGNLIPRQSGISEAEHIACALEDARRYFDGSVAGYYRCRRGAEAFPRRAEARLCRTLGENPRVGAGKRRRGLRSRARSPARDRPRRIATN